ncbi:thermonuclease family protein [Microbacterium sp. CFBP9034]|uniref:thermonuclease family protein n=1 Tax=Microbacterium sp. CFBP9034 TaxID=3096540 RepID=UPI002A69BCB2|nr:thermonuclease family protein [Microbacterium sp. CFBP9034]MDY0910257.1 thermonuclease family protein [Microbacterium sp. CFBP9034]
MKRLVTVAIVVVAAAALAMVVWLSSTTDEVGDATDGAPAPTGEPGLPTHPAGAFPLTVDHVFDGDTIEARTLAPNDLVTTSGPIRIRLIGIDTPEGAPSPECWADEARAHLRELLPVGSTVWAAPDAEALDDYGRHLFNLWTDDGTFLNHELVAAGDAEAIRVWPNVAFYDLLSNAQAQAEASGAGRWGACG